MSKKLAILVIHGMGSQDEDFADEMIDEINSRISGFSLNPDDVAWKTVFWADIVEPRQTKYLEYARKNHDIDYITLRQFVITALGDATAYQKIGDNETATYGKIHSRVSAAINNLYEGDLEHKNCPLIVFAHSLGGHIMSNYIWDMQKASRNGDITLSSFEKMEHLAGFVTFGCNIPVFTFAHDIVVPISFPGEKLTEAEKSKAKWLNYYDPDDILGYPLKAINSAYDKTVYADIPINVGGMFSSWNPISHGDYWTDNNFTKPVSKFISTFL